MKAYIAIPTYNAGELWEEVAKSIRMYSPVDTLVQVIDSSSKDSTVEIAKKYSFEVEIIESQKFNHGATRNVLVSMHESDYDIVIFLTQDAIPEKGFFQNIVDAFKDDNVACAYGRQLPHIDANAISKHARYFNYRETSYKAKIENIPIMGLKAAFTSNSFCAYRVSTFQKVGGFPNNTILSEDMCFAARSILAGYSVAYVAEAMVRHSHNYSANEEYKRYFDIGVFQENESWIRDYFGGAGGEGKRFIISELLFLIKNSPLTLPNACYHNFMKILGYKAGQNYKKLPYKVVKVMSMHKRFWE
ncbi:TPA: glycosyltransferase family 2 protein [Pluralibacter gergoviae]